MTLDQNLLWEKYQSEFSSKFREIIDPNGAISDLRVNTSRRSSYGLYDYREVLARHLKGVGIAVMLHSNSEDSGKRFYDKVFATIDDLLPKFTEEDYQKATEHEKKLGVYRSNQAFGARGEKTLEILEEKKFYEGLDRVYAALEIFRLLTIDKSRGEEPLAAYLQARDIEAVKGYLRQQIGICRQKIVTSTNNAFQKYGIPPIDPENTLFDDVKLFEFTIGAFGNSYGLSFTRDVMQPVSNDIKNLSRYMALNKHFDEGLSRARNLMEGIPFQEMGPIPT